MAEEAIFSFVLETLRDLVIHEAQFLDGVEDQVENLQQKLNEMHWFLRDTSSSTSPDGQKRVLEWVVRVRDLAYQAENLVESYALKVASRRGRGITAKIKRFAGIFNECYLRHQIGSDIETLMSKMNDLTTSLDKHGIRQILENKDNNGAPRRPLLRRTYSTTNDEDDLFVGSYDAIDSLAEKLVDDQYRTVSLYGMGGLGKTTLARKVYHHPTVRKHFDGFSWVSISQQWQKDDTLKGILIKLRPDLKRDEVSKWRDEELVRELSRFLMTTKCLVVLDDIWSIDAWLSIEVAIPIRETGSKVMITTRNVEVATSLDGRGYLHNPQSLTMDQSWELLCKKALRGQDSREIMKVEAIGKEMVTHCSGLPLAVMALGGILSSRHSYDEWEIVLNNIKSYLRSDGVLNVYGILGMSYDDLPFQLKPCFLYLSHYPEDEEIKVETLYQYWMAEGMVSRDDMVGSNETMMDVAERYLRELADRSLVAFVEKVEGYSNSRLKSCRLHDLIRDVCISKAKEEKFFESIDYRYIHDGDEASTRTSSRLSIYLAGEDEAKVFVPTLVKAVSRNLRSFILAAQGFKKKGTLSLNIRLGEFVLLRILSLGAYWKTNYLSGSIRENCTNNCADGMKLPSSIGKLVHLRYFRLDAFRLDLSHTPSFIVPSSIGNLKQLQTLDFGFCDMDWMPNVVWKMAQLSHLYLPYGLSEYLGKKLRLDGLHKLETLEGFDNKVCNVNDLWTLTNLRKLEARLENNLEDMEEFAKVVRKLTHLRVLNLEIIADLSTENALPIINNILSCSYLVDLEIEGKISEWPQYDWGYCRKLQYLSLNYCGIEEDLLSALGRLPELRRLSISDNSFVGKEMRCHAFDFPQLRDLSLFLVNNLERWEIEDGAMPNLSKLQISHCKRLITIPSGLRFITSLKTFQVIGMSEEFKENFELDLFDEISHIQTITCR